MGAVHRAEDWMAEVIRERFGAAAAEAIFYDGEDPDEDPWYVVVLDADDNEIGAASGDDDYDDGGDLGVFDIPGELGETVKFWLELPELPPQLAWVSAGTDDPRDQVADSLTLPRGYWALGPTAEGRWEVELVGRDEELAEIPGEGEHLGEYPTEAKAKEAAQFWEDC